jgi:hypothetical protein
MSANLKHNINTTIIFEMVRVGLLSQFQIFFMLKYVMATLEGYLQGFPMMSRLLGRDVT